MTRGRPAADAPALASAIGLGLALAIVLAAAFPYFEKTRNANELPRILQAIAWLDRGTWSIDGLAVDPGPDTARGVDGRLYPNKPPGTTLVTIVAVATARALADADAPVSLRDATWWARLLGGVLPTLALGAALWLRHARALGVRSVEAGIVTWVLATPAVVYAHLLYGHALAAAAVGIGVCLLGAAVDGSPGRRALALAGFGGALAAFAVTVEYAAAFAAGPIGIWLALACRRPAPRRTVVVAIAGALVPILWLARYHDLAFGSPWQTGYHHATVADFAAKHSQGLLGLGFPTLEGIRTHLLAPGGGLLWWAPALVFGIAGLVALVRRAGPRRAEAAVHLGIVATFLWITCSLSFAGGWRVGPRYAVVALPSLVLGFAAMWSWVRRRPGWIAAYSVLVGHSVVACGLAANLWPHLDLEHVRAPVAEVLLPLWQGSLRPYGPLGVVATVDVTAIGVVGAWVCLVVVAMRAIELRARDTATLVAGAVAGVVLLGAHRWLGRHRDGPRNLAYVQRVWEPRDGVAGPSTVLPARSRGDRGQ